MSDEELAALRARMTQGRTAMICPECKVESSDCSMHPDQEGRWHARCLICLAELLEVALRPAIDPANLCGTDAEMLLEEVEQLRHPDPDDLDAYLATLTPEERGEIDLEGLKLRNQILREQNAALCEVVAAVAVGQTRYVESADRWVLAFSNPTLSYAQALWSKARALVQQQQAPDAP